jgi:hypothetical protein
MSEPKTKSTHTFKTIFYISTITSLVFCIGLIALLICLPTPSLLSYLGYADSVALASAENIKSASTSRMVGELVKNGTLINLKDVWSFQTGFYQTIITFLIAINGLIAAISVIYIKSTSEEKAEETTKKYMNGDSFNHMLMMKIQAESESRLRVVQSELISELERFEQASLNNDEAYTRLARLEEENRSLRQQITVISQRISTLDKSESSGSSNRLVKRKGK